MTLLDQTVERYRKFVILHARCSLVERSPYLMSPKKHLEEAIWGIERYIEVRLKQARQRG